ncbi:MAG: NB-ARC domain-containing protein, partial [Chloroflexota bacterium]
NSLHLRQGANRAVLYNDPDNIVELAPTQLFGREKIMQEIKAHLTETNARVLLQAIGGTGKTVLAAQIAYDDIQNTDKPTLWLRFGASDADSAFEALAHAFNQSNQMASTPTGDKPRLLNQLIKAHNVNLVVLDDVWNGQSLMTVLQGIPRNVPVLVTTRQRYSLHPLISLSDLLPDDAVKLLRKLAPNFTQNDDDVHALAEVLYYHAFALEIAGRTMQAKSYPASRMLKELESTNITELEVPFLKEKGRENIAALLQTTVNALPEDARKAFLAWGAFWSPQITAKLLKEMLTDIDVENALDTLVTYGLATRQSAQNTTEGYPLLDTSYRLHDLAFEYSTSQTTKANKHTAIDACLRFTQEYDSPSRKIFAILEPNMDNLVGAINFAKYVSRDKDVERFVWELYGKNQILSYRGYLLQAVNLLEQSTASSNKGVSLLNRLAHLGNLGNAYTSTGNHDKAIPIFELVLRISR